MREIRTSGLMSGEGKRSEPRKGPATAPFLDSTDENSRNPARWAATSLIGVLRSSPFQVSTYATFNASSRPVLLSGIGTQPSHHGVQ